MHVLIDTNVILDILEKRDPFYSASNDVLSLCASKKSKRTYRFPFCIKYFLYTPEKIFR